MNETPSIWKRIFSKKKLEQASLPTAAITQTEEPVSEAPEKREQKSPIYYEVDVQEYVPATETSQAFATNLNAVQIEAKVEGQWQELVPFFAHSAIGDLETKSELVSGWTHIAWGNNTPKTSELRLLSGHFLTNTDTVRPSILRAKISNTNDNSGLSVLTIIFNVNLLDSFSRDTLLTLDLFTEDAQMEDFIENCEKDNLFVLQILAALLPNVKIQPQKIENNFKKADNDTVEISCPAIKTIVLDDSRVTN